MLESVLSSDVTSRLWGEIPCCELRPSRKTFLALGCRAMADNARCVGRMGFVRVLKIGCGDGLDALRKHLREFDNGSLTLWKSLINGWFRRTCKPLVSPRFVGFETMPRYLNGRHIANYAKYASFHLPGTGDERHQ